MSRFDEFLAYANQYRHFSVSLSGNRRAVQVSEEARKSALANWVFPLVRIAHRAVIYSRRGLLPPLPAGLKSRIISAQNTRVEIDIARSRDDSFAEVWLWALLPEIILTLSVNPDDFPTAELTAECWDPCVIGNVRTLLSANVVSYAKREVGRTHSLCCAFGTSSSAIEATVFAPPEKIASLFTEFARRCQFSHPAQEQGFASIRETPTRKDVR